MVASPYLPPVRFNSYSNLTNMIVPVAPTGWPCFRETEFCAQRQRQRNIQRNSQRAAAETKLTSQVGRFGGNYRMAGKSLRKSECAVGLEGLEPADERL